MSGLDPDRDSTSARPARRGLQRAAQRQPSTACASACPKKFFGDGLASDVRAAVDAALEGIRKLGAKLVTSACRAPSCRFPSYYIIAPAEASVQPEPLLTA